MWEIAIQHSLLKNCLCVAEVCIPKYHRIFDPEPSPYWRLIDEELQMKLQVSCNDHLTLVSLINSSLYTSKAQAQGDSNAVQSEGRILPGVINEAKGSQSHWNLKYCNISRISVFKLIVKI